MKSPADDVCLPLMESFYTIQGEGFHQGKAAYFIRLGGCDVGCHWCDVKESWDASSFPLQPIKTMLADALNFPSKTTVVTGGEPLMYDLSPLTQIFHHNGFQLHLETSGAHPLTGNWDWVCFSPKKFKKPLPEIYNKAHELKVVIYNKSDFQWARSFEQKLSKECKLYLQPEWSRYEQVMPLLIAFVKDNPQWEISLQIHKFMNVP